MPRCARIQAVEPMQEWLDRLFEAATTSGHSLKLPKARSLFLE